MILADLDEIGPELEDDPELIAHVSEWLCRTFSGCDIVSLPGGSHPLRGDVSRTSYMRDARDLLERLSAWAEDARERRLNARENLNR